MSRITITEFSGGIVNAANPLLIPDNTCVEMENYEYRDSQYPSFRKKADIHELQDAPLPDISNIAVWYSRYFPADCVGNKLYVAVAGSEILLIYRSGTNGDADPEAEIHTEPDDSKTGVFTTVTLFDDIIAAANVVLHPGYNRLLIADSEHSGRFVAIDKDGNIEKGSIGIEAPIYLPSVSLNGDDNSYVETDAADTGMQVERGNILQYCYTVEDKYGAESNPSPIRTVTAMMYKYPDASSVTGFKYYWYGASVSNLRLDQYSAEQRKRFKYVNLYRRDIEFKEGTIGTQFRLVERIPIGTRTNVNTKDTNSVNLGDISYDNNVAPASSTVIETSGVIYLGGNKTKGLLFPFEFDRYVEIKIANGNNIDYVNPLISMKWVASEIGIDSWNPYLDNLRKIRLFHGDMITPIPVIYQKQGETLYVIVKACYLTMNSDNMLYLALADTKEGVSREWDSQDYGKFLEARGGNWGLQQVFDINRPLSAQHRICANVPYSWDDITKRNSVFNLANMQSGRGATPTGYSYSPNNSFGQYVFPYYENGLTLLAKPIGGNRGYHIPTMAGIDYTLVSAVKTPHVIVIQGRIDTNTGTTVGLYHCGDVDVTSLVTADAYGVRTITIGVNGAALYQKVIGGGLFLDVYVAIYISGASASLAMYCYALEGHNVISRSANVTPRTADAVVHSPYNVTSMDLARFDLVEVSPLIPIEAERACKCFLSGMTFFKTAIGGWENASIYYELKDVRIENNRNQVTWSNIDGSTFSALNYKLFREPIVAIIAAPSYMRLQYQNTIVVFTRNTVNRMVLSDDLSVMASSANNMIEEYSSGGLYAKHSLVSGGGNMYWLSEAGVMRWGQDSLTNISYGIINIPVHDNYIGAWIDRNSQYLLHDRTSKISYVYHQNTGKWTMFTGLEFIACSRQDLGTSTLNTLLLLNTGNQFRQYPGNADDTDCNHIITTKRFLTANLKPIRYRGMWEIGNAPRVKVRTFNHRMSDMVRETTKENAQRYTWITLPNGFWGEYLQFTLDNVSGLTMLELDIREEL